MTRRHTNSERVVQIAEDCAGEGLSMRETAKVLGVDRGSVKRVIERAYKVVQNRVPDVSAMFARRCKLRVNGEKNISVRVGANLLKQIGVAPGGEVFVEVIDDEITIKNPLNHMQN